MGTRKKGAFLAYRLNICYIGPYGALCGTYKSVLGDRLTPLLGVFFD
jgi:hypothetical protein